MINWRICFRFIYKWKEFLAATLKKLKATSSRAKLIYILPNRFIKDRCSRRLFLNLCFFIFSLRFRKTRSAFNSSTASFSTRFGNGILSEWDEIAEGSWFAGRTGHVKHGIGTNLGMVTVVTVRVHCMKACDMPRNLGKNMTYRSVCVLRCRFGSELDVERFKFFRFRARKIIFRGRIIMAQRLKRSSR